MFYEGVLLMELVVDAHGHPAPRLVDAPSRGSRRARSTPISAGRWCDARVRPHPRRPLAVQRPRRVGRSGRDRLPAGRGRGAQQPGGVVLPARPREPARSFAGDRSGAARPRATGARFWRAYVRRELTPDFVPTGRIAEPPAAERRRNGHVNGQAHLDVTPSISSARRGNGGRDRAGRAGRSRRPERRHVTERRRRARSRCMPSCIRCTASRPSAPGHPGPRQPGPREAGPRQGGRARQDRASREHARPDRAGGPVSGRTRGGTTSAGTTSAGTARGGSAPASAGTTSAGRGPDGRPRAPPAPEVIRVVPAVAQVGPAGRPRHHRRREHVPR